MRFRLPERWARPARRRHYFALGLALALGAVMLFEMIPMVVIAYYARAQTPEPADAAVVLGAAAWGRLPSPVFQERIKHAIALYQNHTVRAIIFTGGTPAPTFPTEAEVGKNYAVRRGVPERVIFIDDQSRDTRANLVNAMAIAQGARFERLILVSDPIHMARVATLARSLNLDFQLSPTPTSRYVSFKSKLLFLWKESQALWSIWLMPKEVYQGDSGSLNAPN